MMKNLAYLIISIIKVGFVVGLCALFFFFPYVFIGGVIILAIFGNFLDMKKKDELKEYKYKQPEEKEQPKQYTACDVKVLSEDLKNNATTAQQKYRLQNLKITGKLGRIDSDGNYIIVNGTQEVNFAGVHCKINKNDKAQKNFVLNLKKDQMVTVYGTIIDVDEIMGYKLKVDKFE